MVTVASISMYGRALFLFFSNLSLLSDHYNSLMYVPCILFYYKLHNAFSKQMPHKMDNVSDGSELHTCTKRERQRERKGKIVCLCVQNPLLKIFVFNALTSMVKTDISSNNKRHRNVLREKERWNWIETGKMGWGEQSAAAA